MADIVQIKRLDSLDALRERLRELGIDHLLQCDDDVQPDGVLASRFEFADGSAGIRTVGNRFCVLPMEGWDATTDGHPTDLVRRRWRNFGRSGAKLIWGGEAVAVRRDGRANGNQLLIDESTVGGLASLREELVAAHAEACGSAEGLVVGIQLTHSGRWSKPDGEPHPLTARVHPALDARLAHAGPRLLGDDDLDALAADFVVAARRAADAGFDFVDIKHCHGYLLHELLGAVDRPGRYGGDLDHRTRFLRTVTEGIRATAPSLAIGVRLSVYDFLPFTAGDDGVGAPDERAAGAFAFGGSPDGLAVDLGESHAFLELCASLGIGLVCVSAGSPYYNPHIQRPAFFPPSDGYSPPNDPLVDVARMVAAADELARAHPSIAVVGSGYSYLQQWLAHVAQFVVRTGGAASIGIGRNMLSYPELPADVLAGRPLRREAICRTFSDCTTAPRNGLISGCYPLDPFYKERPERVELAAVKRSAGRKIRR